MSLREIDIAPVTTTYTKKQLVEVTFRKDADGEVVCIATYRVPDESGGTRLASVRKPLSEVLTAAQAKAMLDKIVS